VREDGFKSERKNRVVASLPGFVSDAGKVPEPRQATLNGKDIFTGAAGRIQWK